MFIYDYYGIELFESEIDTSINECFVFFITVPDIEDMYWDGTVNMCAEIDTFYFEMFGFLPEDQTQELTVVLIKVGGEVLPIDSILQFWNDMSDILADNILNLDGLFYYYVYGAVQPTALGIILCSLLAIPFCVLALLVIALMCRPRK